VDEVLHAVADPTRRAILLLTRDQEASAGEIASHIPRISRPAVSQHLRVLTHAGLLRVRREGSRRLYRLHAEGFAEAAGFLDAMWSARLDLLKAAAEQEAGAPDPARPAPRGAPDPARPAPRGAPDPARPAPRGAP
jgi:DNA-binding transcriptional ArsR family regulator